MSLINAAKKMAAETIWPWIKEYVWPVIQAKLVSEIPEFISWATQKIKAKFGESSKAREDEAMDNARAAESKAAKSTNETEIAVLRREAEVWKTVAQQYKADLDEMKLRIDRVEHEAQSSVKEEITKIDPEIDFGISGAELKIGTTHVALPNPDQ